MNSNGNSNTNSNNKKPHVFTKHSSLKYFKVTPIINPIYNRSYYTPKTTNIQNDKKNNINIKTNLNLDNIFNDIKIKEEDEGTSTTDRQTQSLNKIDNKSLNIMNNIDIINNDLNDKDNKIIKNKKKIVFKKKRIPSCGKKSFSKPKTYNTNNENEITEYDTNSIKFKNKKKENIQFDKTPNVKNNKNNNIVVNNSHKLNENKIMKMKNKNMFNRPSSKKIQSKKVEENHQNIFADIRNKWKKDYNTAYNNNNNNNNNTNIYEQTKIAFKELNLEDFLLIIQKFSDIRKNINYLISFSSINVNTNKNILDVIHINRIKIYDLYKFYMGSSFDGTPEKLFSSKKSKICFHFYTIIFILSIATLYIISQNIELIQEYFQEVINIINKQEKIFLLFCDIIMQKLNKKYKENLWVTQILNILNKNSIFNVNNHITQIKNLTLDVYDIINNLLITINNYNNKNNNFYKYQKQYLYNNFYKKSIEYFNEIEINQIEEDFNENIFKSNSIRNNNSIISPSFKRNITINNFKPINIYNKHNNMYNNIGLFNKSKKNSYTKIYNDTNINNNYTNTNTKTNNISIIKNINSKIYTVNNNNQYIQNNNKSINSRNNPYALNYPSSIQQYDIQIPDTDIIIPPVTIPFLNFHTNKKYTLIIDLDETMVNFKFINIKKGFGKLFIRPYLENFLEVIKDYYEIISFTSATRDYADIVLDIIEKNNRKKYFDGRLYREHTTRFGKKYIKDLSKMGRDLEKIIIVDNLSQCFKLHSDNGILISSFYGEDENDKALIELQKILIKIFYENCDVRISINKFKDEILNKISKSQMNYS